MIAQVSGLRFTLPSTSGFLTALAVVFAPLAQAFVFRRPVSKRTWLAVAIACAGIGILSQPNVGADTQTLPPATPPFPFFGEGLTILAALFFTGHILTVEHYGRTGDAARLTLLMFAVMGLVSVLLGAMLDGGPIYTGPVVSGIVTDTTVLWSLASLIVFCSAAAMHLMNSYQPLISAAQATVVYCLEPLFATLFSRLFGLEQLTATTLAGGTVILLAVLLIARQQAVESRQRSG
jgi:drug/metabolite transporter (DMT)-like permease